MNLAIEYLVSAILLAVTFSLIWAYFALWVRFTRAMVMISLFAAIVFAVHQMKTILYP